MRKASNLILILILIGGIFLISCKKQSKQDITDDLVTGASGSTGTTGTTGTTVASKPTGVITFATLNKEELLFDNVHYALGSLIYNGSGIAVDGQSVGKIPDKKGTADLLYAGITAPTITGVPPSLIDSAKWLMFDNRPNTYYNSAPVTPINPPFEATLVSRNMPGQLFEAKMQNGGNALYFGDIGSPIRVFDANGNIPNSTKPANYQTIIERLVVKTSTVEYWLNGKFVGAFNYSGLASDVISANTIKKFHSIGTFTNNMDFDFAALYFKAGVFSDADYATVYNSLATKWKVGSIPNQILLSDIKWANNNGTYTPRATVINTPDGVSVADPSKWDYQWFWKDDETNYDKQTLFSTNMTVTTADFPANDATHHNVCIKFRVRPKDSNGKSWRYLSGTFDLTTLSSQ